LFVERWFRRTAVALSAVLVLALGACGGDDDSGDDETGAGDRETTTTTEESTTTTAALTPEEQVLRDYDAARQAVVASANPPNPDHPDLLAHFGGDALARQQSLLREWQDLNVGARTTVETHPEVTSITGTAATVRDCFTDSSQVIDLATGRPGESGSTTQHVDVTLEQRDGVWILTRQELREDPCPS
jgi:hypothetical protein